MTHRNNNGMTARPQSAPGAAPRTRLLAVIGAAVLCTACSGGGGGSATSPAAPDPPPAASNCGLDYTSASNPSPLVGLDPLLADQWHLRNTGQSGGLAGEDLRALDARSSARGRGTRVAIIDGPVETVHEDLAANIAPDAQYDYRTHTAGAPLPCSSLDEHGTAVAGIIAAVADNGRGGSGVAPAASLGVYNALSTGSDADIADALSRDRDRTDIYHNSWGSPDDGRLHAAEAAFVSAIDTGLSQGRGGKGALYVFASGNGGCYLSGDLSGCLGSELATYDGYLNQPGVIAACAVNHRGELPAWGEQGANLLVCGLSGSDTSSITTTALRNGYRSNFAGASAAAPMVSGVIALMLEVNPALSWRDVRLILARSARENAPTDSSWQATSLTNASGGAKRYSHKFGYGVADAQAAVTLAASWSSIGGSSSLRRCTLPARGPGAGSPFPVTLPDASGASVTPRVDAISVGAVDCALSIIEHVEVRFSALHDYSGDLRVELRSPAGHVSQLAAARACSNTSRSGDHCGRYDNWLFASNRHLNESPIGTWQLGVTDMTPGQTGQWTGWSLTLVGR